MPDPTPVSSLFPVAHCDACGKTVLTCVALDDDGGEHRLCAHCDSAIAGEVAWIPASELEETGYTLGAPRPRASSCGGGCGGGCATRRA